MKIEQLIKEYDLPFITIDFGDNYLMNHLGKRWCARTRIIKDEGMMDLVASRPSLRGAIYSLERLLKNA